MSSCRVTLTQDSCCSLINVSMLLLVPGGQVDKGLSILIAVSFESNKHCDILMEMLGEDFASKNGGHTKRRPIVDKRPTED